MNNNQNNNLINVNKTDRNNNFLLGKQISRNTFSEMFFYVAIICELLVSFSGYLIGCYHEKLIILFGMLMFAISILCNFKFKRDFVPCFLLGAIGLLCYYFQNSACIMRIALAILAGRDKDCKKVIKIFFYGTLAGMVYFGLLSGLGLHNSIYIDAVYRSTIERRFTFGFYNPNGYCFFVFRLLLMGLYVYIDRLKIFSFLAVSLVFLTFMLLGKSKMGLAVLLLVLLLFGLESFVQNKTAKKIISCTACLSVIGIVLFLLYIKFQDFLPQTELVYKLWMLVDKLTTGRSGDSYYAFINNVPSLWGSKEMIISSEIGYVSSIYNEGIIFLILFALTVLYLIWKFIKIKNYKGLILITGCLLYSISESFLVYFNKNMIWFLCIGNLFCINNIKKENQ